MLNICILAHNGRACLPWNLDNLRFWVSLGDARLIVLDQGSTDGTSEYLDSLEASALTVLHSPFNRCIVDGRQRLLDLLRLSLTTEDIVIFLDQDTRMTDAGWLDALLKPLRDDPGVGIVGSYAPSFIVPDESGHWHILAARVPGEVDVVSACVTAYRASIFLDGVEFDPIFAPMWEEDADLCLQARIRGWKVWGLPPSIGMFHAIEHKEGDLLRERNQAFLKHKWEGKVSLLGELYR